MTVDLSEFEELSSRQPECCKVETYMKLLGSDARETVSAALVADHIGTKATRIAFLDQAIRVLEALEPPDEDSE